MPTHTCSICGQNKEEEDFYTFARKQTCRECNDKRHYQKYKEYFLDKGKKRRDDPSSKEKMREYDREWKRERRRNSPEERIKNNLRNRLKVVLKGIRKYVHLKDCLGCDIQTLLRHIEGQWVDGMTWSNYGKLRGEWNVDHIKPMSSFDLTKKEEQLACNNYLNLRPMWAVENSRKGAKIV